MKNRLPFMIIFEDAKLIVIDKPAGLLTTHTHLHGRYARETQATAENYLNDYVRKGQRKSSKRVYLIHRLDRETSGVIAFAKSEEFANRLRDNWAEASEKTYLARVGGVLETDHGVFESFLKEDADGYRVRSVPPGRGGKAAKTEWRKLSVEDGTTLVEVKLHTGRKNQIRVHFAEAGHPLIGDVKYGGERASRLYLHALELKLTLPEFARVFHSDSPF